MKLKKSKLLAHEMIAEFTNNNAGFRGRLLVSIIGGCFAKARMKNYEICTFLMTVLH